MGVGRNTCPAIQEFLATGEKTMLTNEVIFDAIVIGGSFAGLSGAMHLARTGRNICVIDGGQPRNRLARASHGFFEQDGLPPHQVIAEARAKFQAYPNVIFRDSLAL
jgi:thioredoxin reductase